MIPDSLVALVCFLLLLAPGIVWELDRQRFKPVTKETGLIEASRIILGSLAATSLAALPLIPFLWIPLYGVFGVDPGPEQSSNEAVLAYSAAVVLHALLACGMVLIISAFVHRGKPSIKPERVWHMALVSWKDEKAADPRLVVELTDGTVWRGVRMALDADPEDNHRSLALGQPLKRKRSGDESFSDIADRWEVVILAERDIKSIQVSYPQPSP